MLALNHFGHREKSSADICVGLIWVSKPMLFILLTVLQRSTVYSYVPKIICLPLQNHKAVEDVAENQYQYTNNSVGDGPFGLVCFFFITTSCEYEKTSIHNHDNCYEGNKAIEEDENFCKHTKDACSIEDSIGTIRSNTKYLLTSTVSTTIGDFDSRLCQYHNDKSEDSADKYPFAFIKPLLITTSGDDAIKGIDSDHEETCRSNKTQKIQNRVNDIDRHIVDCLSINTFFAENARLELSYNCVGYGYDEESSYAPNKSIHPFCEVFLSIIRDE